tara:strand:+ start:595 stop:2985 length:2391 start_codon:yes stop_codon:yes gene_type:complete
MKNKNILLFAISVFINFLLLTSSNGNEFIFETTKIEIFEDGNKVIATKGNAQSQDGNITIDADKFIYNKALSTLEAIGNVLLKDNKESILINAKNIFYNQNSFLIEAYTNVEIRDLSKNLKVNSDQIFYNILDEKIYSEKKSKVTDKFNNIFYSDSFVYEKKNSLVKITGVHYKDKKKNNSYFERAFINLNTNRLLAKDISTELNDLTFSKENNPRLKGNTLEMNNKKSIIKKGVFTTCKKNDDCPPWQISAKEITHDKKKKTIFYKDAWLRLYDTPVFYFPKFFHPDPTVKRRSGFLVPSFTNSSNLGTSFNLPYYFAVADNKDLTLSPVISDKNQLMQVEYRGINKDSSINLDTSLLNQKDDSSKTHFFAKVIKKIKLKNFENSKINLEIQQTSDDTFLKTYKLRSPLITNNSTLTSTLGFNAYREDLSLDLDFKIYEDLSIKDSDRYEYIYPNYNLMKQFNLDNTKGNFSLDSKGYIKNYDTNIFESVAINNLIYDSNYSITDLGLKNNYKVMLKNINTDSKNSSKYKNSPDYQLGSMLQYNSTLPLKKENTLTKSILMPLASFKFSPNKSKNINDSENKIDINNIFSFNRIGLNDNIEEGASLTYGVEYFKTNKKDNRRFFRTKIANNLRYKDSDALPTNNGIMAKTSDFMGIIEINPLKELNLNYEFNIDENLKDKNSETLAAALQINNFATSFEYFNQNNTYGKNSYLDNTTSYMLGKDKELIFNTRENKETSITEFYNLVYRYYNDCLIAAVEYNKDYYNDRDLKPEENIFFKLTIIPLGTNQSPNLLN